MTGPAKNAEKRNVGGKSSKPKLTDAERHKRFVDMAREVEASEDPKEFERAFDKVVAPKRLPRSNRL